MSPLRMRAHGQFFQQFKSPHSHTQLPHAQREFQEKSGGESVSLPRIPCVAKEEDTRVAMIETGRSTVHATAPPCHGGACALSVGTTPASPAAGKKAKG